MDRKKRIKRVKILIFIILLAAMGYFTYNCIDNYKNRWNSIDQSYMDDFDGDGEPEMLIIYNYHKTKSAMKLLDIPSGKTIWKSSCHPSHIHEAVRIKIVDSTLMIAYNDFVNNPYKDDYEKHLIGIEGFDCKTGEKIWDTKIDSSRNMGLYFYLAGNQRNVLFHSTAYPLNKSFLTSIEPKTGNIKWEIGFPVSFLSTPYFLSNTNCIVHGYSKMYNLNLLTSDTNRIEINRSLQELFVPSTSEYYSVENNILYKTDTVKNPVIFNNDTININKDTTKYIENIALYKNCLIAVDNNYNENNCEIKAIPFSSESQGYSYKLTDGSIESFLYSENTYKDPEKSSFHIVKTRYIPFIKRRKIDDQKEAKQLIVFDIEQGKVNWTSDPVIQLGFGFYSRNIYFYKGYYLICFDTQNEANQNLTFITMNGSTGKFEKCITFKPDNIYASNNLWHGYSKFKDNCFYGSTYSVAWCLSFPEMELIFSTDEELKTFNNKPELEEIFGKLP